MGGFVVLQVHKNYNVKIGQRFGKWKVIKKSEKQYHFLCRCDCGKEKDVPKYRLLTGYSDACANCHVKRPRNSKSKKPRWQIQMEERQEAKKNVVYDLNKFLAWAEVKEAELSSKEEWEE
jgi:hypothetical protein